MLDADDIDGEATTLGRENGRFVGRFLVVIHTLTIVHWDADRSHATFLAISPDLIIYCMAQGVATSHITPPAC